MKGQLSTTLLFKKFLNINYYNKSLIRSTLLNNNRINLIDNYSNFETLQSSRIKFQPIQHLKQEGLGLPTKAFTYTNRLNHFIKFRLNTCSLEFKDVNLLSSFDKTLLSLTEKANTFNTFLLLTPIKGGFKAYSSGLFGFLPSNQIKVLFLEFEKNLFTFLSHDTNLDFLELFKKTLSIKKNFLFRFPLFIGKISIYPGFKKNNFSKAQKVKRKVFSSDLNIVFLVQPMLKKAI